MKKIIAFALIGALIPLAAFAASTLTRDSNGIPIQGFTPNGGLTAALTAPNTTVDMTMFTAGAIYSSDACKIRYMPKSNSTKASYVQSTIPSGGYYTRIVAPGTPFWNISGCVGVMEKQ